MKSHLVQIGNSKGVRIPKSMLDECNLEKDIEIFIQKKNIIIKPLKAKRNDWNAAFKKMSKNNDDELLIDLSGDEEDWKW